MDVNNNTNSTNPRAWNKGKKWGLSLFCAMMQLAFTLGSSGTSPAIPFLMIHFSISRVVAILSVGLYLLGLAFGALLFPPFSEVYGRKAVIIPTWTVFCLFIVGSALAQNIHTLLICRFLAGFFGSSVMTVNLGTINDIWAEHDAGLPVGVFVISAFLGPILGPITGGYLVQGAPGGIQESWRWTQWFLLIFGAVLGINLLWTPETHAPTLARRHQRKRANSTENLELKDLQQLQVVAIPQVDLWNLLKRSITRPLKLLFLDPIVLLMSLYMSVIFGILFIYFGGYQLTFSKIYGWSPGHSGLAFLGIGLGIILAMPTTGYSNKIYLDLKRKHTSLPGEIYPEARLPMAFPASILAPASAFWFGWSSNKDVHWIAPVLSGVPFGWSIITIFSTHFGYLNDTYPEYGASIIGAATFIRSLFAFGFPMFSPALYANLKPGWAGTLLGFLLVAFAPLPWIFYRYGPRLRAKSSFSQS